LIYKMGWGATLCRLGSSQGAFNPLQTREQHMIKPMGFLDYKELERRF
jgi:hypothetical protein